MPVYNLLFFQLPSEGKSFAAAPDGLKLPHSSVSVYYKTYPNTYKDGIKIGQDGLSLRDAVEKKLTPG